MDYTKILKEICAELDLGVLLEEPHLGGKI